MWDVGCGMWDVGCGMWDVGCGMWDVGCGMWDVGCGMWDVGCEMWDVGCGMWDERCEMLISIFTLPFCNYHGCKAVSNHINSGTGHIHEFIYSQDDEYRPGR